MTKAETKVLLGYLATIYRNYYKGTDLDFTVLAWAELLMDEKPEYIMAAAKAFIKDDQLGFPPTPGQLLPIAKEIKRKSDDAEKDKMRLPEPDPVPLTEEEVKAREERWNEARMLLRP